VSLATDKPQQLEVTREELAASLRRLPIEGASFADLRGLLPQLPEGVVARIYKNREGRESYELYAPSLYIADAAYFLNWRPEGRIIERDEGGRVVGPSNFEERVAASYAAGRWPLLSHSDISDVVAVHCFGVDSNPLKLGALAFRYEMKQRIVVADPQSVSEISWFVKRDRIRRWYAYCLRCGGGFDVVPKTQTWKCVVCGGTTSGKAGKSVDGGSLPLDVRVVIETELGHTFSHTHEQVVAIVNHAKVEAAARSVVQHLRQIRDERLTTIGDPEVRAAVKAALWAIDYDLTPPRREPPRATRALLFSPTDDYFE
jgi:hypothetical protein